MIRIHFDNKEYVDIKTTLKNFIECANKVKNGQINWIILNYHTMLNFGKVVYVEEMEENNEII